MNEVEVWHFVQEETAVVEAGDEKVQVLAKRRARHALKHTL